MSFEFGKYYHIYNRGHNKGEIFMCNEDIEYFKKLIVIYVKPVSDILSWSILNNHYHFCIQVKEQNSIGYFDCRKAGKRDAQEKWQVFFEEELPEVHRKRPVPFKQWQYLFDTYARYFNNKYKRRGTIFENHFGVREIEDNEDLFGVIKYINRNPEKHGLVKYFSEYEHSSYYEIINDEIGICNREAVLEHFGGIEVFTNAHQKE